jgi:hypothetical protein
MKKPSFRVCSTFVLGGALTATLAGSSCTAEDEPGNLERLELRGYDDGHDDDGHDDDDDDDGHDDGGDHETCEVDTQEIVLWPPNHQLVAIDVEDCIEDVHHCGHDCEAKITSVSSDEPVDDLGDGNTEPDIVCVDDDTVEVRRERSGTGDGRVYTIEFRLECEHDHDHGDYDHDHDDHEATGTCKVSVPHDQGQGSEAVDSGPVYSVSCESC